MQNERRYDWVVFDSTGTLMQPHPEAASVYQAVGRDFGLELPLESVRSRLKVAIQNHFFGQSIDQPTDEGFEDKRWRSIVAETLPGLSEEIFNDAFLNLWRRFADVAGWRLFPDVEPLLKRLRERGYRLAVASNFDRRLRRIADGFHLTDKLDEILISSELGFSKPSKRFYDQATLRLQATDRSRLLMIGDTFRGDVEAARGSGWHARLLVRDHEHSLAELTSDL